MRFVASTYTVTTTFGERSVPLQRAAFAVINNSLLRAPSPTEFRIASLLFAHRAVLDGILMPIRHME